MLVAGTAFAAPSAKTVSSYDETKRIQLIEWVEQLRVKAGEADKKAGEAQEALVQSQSELAAANSNLSSLKEDIKKMEDWGKEQQALVASANDRADKQQAIAEKKTKEAHRNAVQRDICVFLFSVACTVLVLIYGGHIIGFVVRTFPALTPYGVGLWIALAILSFSAVFGAAEGFLALVYSKF